jgi:hypothetical protein
MNEAIVTRAQADALFAAMLVVGLVAAPVAFATARKRGGDGLAAALLWGGPLVLVGILWRVYNAITDRIGLDRVANLGVNLALFVTLGAACGFGWAKLAGRRGMGGD